MQLFLIIIKINFRFQSKLCDGCHDLMQKAMSFNDNAIVSVRRIDYRIHSWYMSKDEATDFSKNVDLRKISATL